MAFVGVFGGLLGGGALEGFVGGLLLAAILAYPIYRLLVFAKAQQVVSKHLELHQAKAGTPTMGGWIFVLAYVPVAFFSGVRLGFVLPFLGFALLGWLDDYFIPRWQKGSRGLEWKPKILAQLTLGVAVSFGLRHFGNGHWDFARLAWDIFCVLLFANAFNFTDGLDGLAFSVGIGLFVGLGAVAWVIGFPELAVPLAVLAGAMIPFGYLNKPKAKLFMGDTGSMPVGALVGAIVAQLGWVSFSHSEVLVSLLVLSFVMLAELIPPPMQIFWVKVFKKRLFPMTPIHHAFEKAGWKETRIVLLFAGIQFVCSALAVFVAWRFR